MDDLLTTKGVGRRVMSLVADDGCALRLLTYTDGSWSVQRDGCVCGTWEAGDLDACLRAFLQFAGDEGPIAVVFLRNAGGGGWGDPSSN